MKHIRTPNRMANIRILRSISILFALICYSGMVFQLTCILRMYFEYKAESRMTAGIPHNIRMHTISLCMPFRYFSDFRPKSNISHRVWEIVTQDQMMQHTPSADHLLTGFMLRKNTFHYGYYNETMISKFWNISKFTLSDYVCYRIQPSSTQLINVAPVSTSAYGTGSFFTLHINSSWPFERISSFRPVLHDWETYPRHAFLQQHKQPEHQLLEVATKPFRRILLQQPTTGQ